MNAASDEFDVRVTIGSVACNITSLASTQLVCIPPQVQPAATDEVGKATAPSLPLVVVSIQDYRFPFDFLSFPIQKFSCKFANCSQCL